MRTRSFWGWGWQDELPSQDERDQLTGLLSGFFADHPPRPAAYPSLDDIVLPEPAVAIPEVLAAFCSADKLDRAGHTYGKNYRDLVRGFSGDFSPAPDFVAYPENEEQIQALLAWAVAEGVTVVPYGGGTTVVEAVECSREEAPRHVTLDLGRMDRVLEVDQECLAARIQAGARGPVLQEQLAEHGLTFRHYPQSVEFSTLGGWIATRAGGHYATLYTHVDDFVESIRMVTPEGVMESRRLPGSGAGPSPDRMMIGSEGIFGVITEAWIRVQKPPVYRANASVKFGQFDDAVAACRALAQSGLYPTNCRLLDATEALINEVSGDFTHVLLLAFESSDHSLKPWMDRALEICAERKGRVATGPTFKEAGERSSSEGEGGQWRDAFFRAPYRQSAMVSLGMIADTFETAITWERFPALHAAVQEAVMGAMREHCGSGLLSCRFTHVYPDGPAPYYTFIAPGQEGKLLEQWYAIKKAAGDALIREGATITHHHAVGKLHRPWYEAQRPQLFGDVLKVIKGRLDPAGILNPNVLIRRDD
jgi:alkyldihydroxyacetonephosphate synthase